MDAKRLLRGPLFWVLIFVFAAIVLTRMLDSSGGFERVDTSQVVSEIDAGNVKSAKIVGGKTQKIQLTLKTDDLISAQYVKGQGIEPATRAAGAAGRRHTPRGLRRRGADGKRPAEPDRALLPFILLAC